MKVVTPSDNSLELTCALACILQAKEQLETHAVDVALLHQAAAHADQETAHREIELQETRQSLQQTCARVKKLEAQLAQQRQLRRDALKQLCTVSTERDSTVRAHMATLKELEEAGAQVVQLQKKLDTKTGQLLDSGRYFPPAHPSSTKALAAVEVHLTMGSNAPAERCSMLAMPGSDMPLVDEVSRQGGMDRNY